VSPKFPFVIAIPAKDEIELLPLCLDAFARQRDMAFEQFAVVVSCNNCVDGTAECARLLAPRLPFHLVVDEIVLPAEIAHAGGARRRAMDAALDLAREDGAILTSDADGVADEDWVAAMAEALAGADVVAGRVDTNWDELSRFPADVLEVGALEWEYQGLSAELEARLDPDPANPWPRHNQTCGANAAIRAEWYRRIGGLRVIRTGEDAAMFDSVFRLDGIVRNAMRPHVTVSARLAGRAQGGMADALSLRHGDQYLCDDLLEPTDDLMRRAGWRHEARAAFVDGRLEEWAMGVGLSRAVIGPAVLHQYFGSAWREIEARAPILIKRRIPGSAIGDELSRMKAVLRHLHEREAP
jgi:hypothetical protein